MPECGLSPALLAALPPGAGGSRAAEAMRRALPRGLQLRDGVTRLPPKSRLSVIRPRRNACVAAMGFCVAQDAAAAAILTRLR